MWKLSLSALRRGTGFQPVIGLFTPVYHGFTAGFDSQDLQTAKALLDAIAAGCCTGENENR